MPAGAALLARVLGQIKLAVYVFEGGRQVYANETGAELSERLRLEEHIELRVLVADHLAALATTPRSSDRRRGPRAAPTMTLLSSPKGEPFYIHVIPLGAARDSGAPVHAVTVRSTGADIHAFRQRYRLTPREAHITELVRRGWSNRDIAQQLRIAPATAKKHLGRIFDKVGADSRAHLIAKLG